jgi:hypothetical protein
MSNIPDRADSRQPIRMRKQNCGRDEVPCNNCMKCKINADIASSGIPDDTETTGPTGIRKKPVLEGEKDPEVKKLYGKE